MEILKNMIYQIIVIILLGTALELILPSGKLRPFVKVIVGLFVMIAVMNPIMNFLRHDAWQMSFGPVAQAPVEMNMLRSIGEGIREKGLEESRKEAVEKLARHAESLLSLKPGMEGWQIVVDWSQVQAGNEGAVTVHLTGPQEALALENQRSADVDSKSSRQVDEIKVDMVDVAPAMGTKDGTSAQIGLQEKPQTVDRKSWLESEIVKTMAGFYGLKPEQIQVKWEKEGGNK